MKFFNVSWKILSLRDTSTKYWHIQICYTLVVSHSDELWFKTCFYKYQMISNNVRQNTTLGGKKVQFDRFTF